MRALGLVVLLAISVLAQNSSNSTGNATNATSPTSAPTSPPTSLVDPYLAKLPFDFDIENDIFGYILGGVVTLIGLVFVVFGSRLFKIAVFIINFLLGAALGFFLMGWLFENDVIGLIVGAVMGLVLGVISVKVLKLSLFLTGAAVGAVIWLLFKALTPELQLENYISYAILAGLCLALGLIAIKLEKWWLIICTPIMGAFLLAVGVHSFVPESYNIFQIVANDVGCGSGDIACYALYGSIFVVALFGFILQWRCTSQMARERIADGKEDDGRRDTRKERRKKRRKKKQKRSRRRSDSRDRDRDRRRHRSRTRSRSRDRRRRRRRSSS